MLFVFPVIFIASFIAALKDIWKGNNSGILTFIIFGLSIYTTAMSVTFLYGFKDVILFLQSLKELMVLLVLFLNISALKERPRFHLIDYLIFTFIGYLLIYTIMPIGGQAFTTRLLALKSMAFYIVVYFAARFINPKTVFVSKYFNYVVLLTIGAAAVLMTEIASQTPLQFKSGYFDYSYYFFHLDADGPFGLKATFNSDSGYIRFASFFTSPLEHAGATLLALAIILALYTKDNNKFDINTLGLFGIAATILSILFSLSRAPLASYLLVIYIYSKLTHKKLIVNTIQTCFAIGAIYIGYLFYDFETSKNSLISVLMNTIDFSDPSSVGHLVQWVEGITAIAGNPLGLGLGTSGRVAASISENIGGENQLIIIGVQAGVIAILLYVSIFVVFIRMGVKWLPRLTGNERKICLAVLLIKVGILISTLTSEVESSTYLSYMNWFLSGLFVSILMRNRITPPTPVYAVREIN